MKFIAYLEITSPCTSAGAILITIVIRTTIIRIGTIVAIRTIITTVMMGPGRMQVDRGPKTRSSLGTQGGRNHAEELADTSSTTCSQASAHLEDPHKQLENLSDQGLVRTLVQPWTSEQLATTDEGF